MSQNFYENAITVKRTAEMDVMIEYLEDKLLLNPTAILRYCLARVYEEERKAGGLQWLEDT